jgi:hypothetical protein
MKTTDHSSTFSILYAEHSHLYAFVPTYIIFLHHRETCLSRSYVIHAGFLMHAFISISFAELSLERTLTISSKTTKILVP